MCEGQRVQSRGEARTPRSGQPLRSALLIRWLPRVCVAGFSRREWGTAMASLLCSTCSGLGGLSGCGSRAWLLHGRRRFSGPGVRPVSAELAGGFLTTGPPGSAC